MRGGLVMHAAEPVSRVGRIFRNYYTRHRAGVTTNKSEGMTNIKIGELAPNFDLPGDSGTTVSLAAHRGDIVVLFFYPKDDTPACTTEAIDFTALKPQFDALGVVLIGVSPDSAKKHDRFKTKHELTVALASDEERAALESYGLWVEKSMYGRKYMGVERTTLLIDGEGRIARIWNKVKVRGHAAEVLEAARALAGRDSGN